MSGQEGLAAIVRCLLVDSGLPHFLWGELMQTAVYVSNRVPWHWLMRRHTRRSIARTLISDTFGRSGRGRWCMWKRTPRCCRIVPMKDVLPATASTTSLSESITHRRGVYVRTGPSFSSRHLQPVSRFDEGEFTYDDYDDMVGDVRNCTSKLDVKFTCCCWSSG